MLGMLVDVTKCIGCHSCVDACLKANGLRREIPVEQRTADGLSARRWVSILPRSGKLYMRKSCMHCLQPSCVAVCPTGALRKTAEGPVVSDAAKCNGCRLCAAACPYGIPRFEWDTPSLAIRKCDMCFDRVRAGKAPACVDACPRGTLSFGTRQDLLAMAHERIRSEPGRYLPRVYGGESAGATSVLYISSGDLPLMGWDVTQSTATLLRLAAGGAAGWQPLTLGAAALVAGTGWIIRRRMRLMEPGPGGSGAGAPAAGK